MMLNTQVEWTYKAAQTTLKRLSPRIYDALPDDATRTVFQNRLETHFPKLFPLLHNLYGHHYDFFYHLEQILLTSAKMFAQRPQDLKHLDDEREANPLWFQSEKMMGAVCYVDLFAGDLEGLYDHLPYFEELGLTYLHLMPLFRAPEGPNDGGYAVSSFREVAPKLGTMTQLRKLATELRERGISIVLDLVFNHTSDEHEWALKAQAGDEEYQAYYRMFEDRSIPDQYEPYLREIFPEQAPGSFTYRHDIGKWVWTTFNSFQWDLNYSNPALFRAMFEEMMFLANQGIEILRLDAVPFVWKELGTNCENLPQSHTIIQALNVLTRITAPALLFKSEAIVHPKDIASYIGSHESQLSYNPTLMVCLWESLATRQVKLMRQSMQKRFEIPDDCAWINYVRSHDDIGWGFADEDAAEVHINGFDHRHFLNTFYIGMFPSSFAKGLPFNFNPRTQDMRISGTTASLAGLEKALDEKNEVEIENAIRRILLIQSVVLSAGGIPLIYLGDELGTLNDYSYENDFEKRPDNRWVHRPALNPETMKQRHDPATIAGRIFLPLLNLIKIRKSTPAFADGQTVFFDTGNNHVFGYVRHSQMLILCNFSEYRQTVQLSMAARYFPLSGRLTNLVNGQAYTNAESVVLAPYEFLWIIRQR